MGWGRCVDVVKRKEDEGKKDKQKERITVTVKALTVTEVVRCGTVKTVHNSTS